jgi:hypothetical protein
MRTQSTRSHFWTDLNAIAEWRFSEIPPWQIEGYLGSPVVDHWERIRAMVVATSTEGIYRQ